MDPLTFILAVMAPGLTLMVAALVVIVRRSIRSRAPSVWGLRLFYVGFGLLNLVPGVAMIAAVLLGRLLWPAAFAGLWEILIGSGVLYGLRRWWDDPAHRPGDSRRPN